MSHLQPAPMPKSPLGIHRVLAPTAGVKVSPICLGAMNFGDKWSEWMGECNKKTTFEILDAFYEMGGNFIDTANAYQYEESEEWLGEWMESRKNRDEIVLATKFASSYRMKDPNTKLQSNYTGNAAKSLQLSLKDSLRKLKTDYIDLLYLHWWDFTTSIEEIMHTLNGLVLAGKVLYLGISDTPAWVVVKANAYARQHGLRPFSVYQGRWSASFRDMEREIIPMCQDEGMAIAPWGPLGQGKLMSAADRENAEKGGRSKYPATEHEIKISEALEKIAVKKGSTVHGIALAYVLHKSPYVFPIVGQRKVEHLKANVDALSVELSKEEIHEIDDAADFDAGFPMNFIFMMQKYHLDLDASNVTLTRVAAPLDVPPKQSAVKPHPRE